MQLPACFPAASPMLYVSRVLTLQPLTDRKQKRQKGQLKQQGQSPGVAVALYAGSVGGEQVAGSVANADAWTPGRVLQVGDSCFSIAYNPPTVQKVPAAFPAPQARSASWCAWASEELLCAVACAGQCVRTPHGGLSTLSHRPGGLLVKLEPLMHPYSTMHLPLGYLAPEE